STTAAPFFANAAAVARPMPLEAPVTTTTGSSAIAHLGAVGLDAFDEHEAVTLRERPDGAEILVAQCAGGAALGHVGRILGAAREQRADPAALGRLDHEASSARPQDAPRLAERGRAAEGGQLTKNFVYDDDVEPVALERQRGQRRRDGLDERALA